MSTELYPTVGSTHLTVKLSSISEATQAVKDTPLAVTLLQGLRAVPRPWWPNTSLVVVFKPSSLERVRIFDQIDPPSLWSNTGCSSHLYSSEDGSHWVLQAFKAWRGALWITPHRHLFLRELKKTAEICKANRTQTAEFWCEQNRWKGEGRKEAVTLKNRLNCKV